MRPFLFLLCIPIHVVAASAQTPPAQPLSVDLGRYYFKSPEAETAARGDLDSALKRLGKFQGQINTGQRLLAALRSYEEVLKLYRYHEAYLRLQCSLNRKDPACEANGKLGSEINAETAFLMPEILAIPKERLEAFQAAEPGLRNYQFALDNIRRDAPHVLPNAEQAFLDRLHREIADWQYDLYEQILGGISFGTVQTATGPLDEPPCSRPSVQNEGPRLSFAPRPSRVNCILLAPIVAHLPEPEPKTRSPAWLTHKYGHQPVFLPRL